VQQTDLVLRALVDAALAERRHWKSAADLAWEAGVGEKLAYKALGKPASIGAVIKHPGGGFSTTDPERVLMLLAARRSLSSARHTAFDAAQTLLAESMEYAIGGTRAAVQHLGGRNTIADHAPAIVYVPEGADLDDLPAGDSALVLTVDDRSFRVWADGFTSKAQTYADLFAQPGWQASEFRRALWKRWFGIDDWNREGAVVG
jgi:hypothetical protein